MNDKPSSDPSSEAPNEQQANEPVSPETDANNAAVSGEQDESLATDSDDEDQSRSDAGAENSLEAQLEALSAQLSNAKDEQLRTQAEMQNLRRRAERDVEKAHKFGLEKLINGLLPVLDNFDRAIAAVPEAAADDEVVKSLLEDSYEGYSLNSMMSSIKNYNRKMTKIVGLGRYPQVFWDDKAGWGDLKLR